MAVRGRRSAGIGITVVVLAAAIFALAQCAESLPRSEEVTRSVWLTFDAAKAAYDEVKPGETSVEALKKMGYDPYGDNNVRVMSYLDINRLFVAGDSKTTASIPAAVRACLDAQAECLGYGVNLEHINRKRVGSTFLDLLNFRRKTHETGWSFRAVFVIHKDYVVYKLWSGAPKIDRQTDRENPLGPIQEPVDVIKKAMP
ncbi:MAG: hypothetical protein OEO83_03875 [Alphaproteobacteria bacterium]|nr:hypothetical protein [Alphaproteobacteria bacterium]